MVTATINLGKNEHNSPLTQNHWKRSLSPRKGFKDFGFWYL